MAFLIYGLFDPRNGELRYIGKTEDEPRLRYNQHICSSQGKR